MGAKPQTKTKAQNKKRAKNFDVASVVVVDSGSEIEMASVDKKVLSVDQERSFKTAILKKVEGGNNTQKTAKTAQKHKKTGKKLKNQSKNAEIMLAGDVAENEQKSKFSMLFAKLGKPVIGLVLVLLLLSLGLIWTVRFNTSDKTANISGFDYIKANSLTLTEMIQKSAELASEDKLDSGEYMGIALVSTERSYRTAESKGFVISAMVSYFLMIGLALASISVDCLNLFEYYRDKFRKLGIALKIALVVSALCFMASIVGYLIALPSAVSSVYTIGASVIILPIICALIITNMIVFKVLEKNKRKEI